MPPTTVPAHAPGADAIGDDEFRLELRVIESAIPLAVMTCDTSDGCGQTCSTTACSTSSNDPF